MVHDGKILEHQKIASAVNISPVTSGCVIYSGRALRPTHVSATQSKSLTHPVYSLFSVSFCSSDGQLLHIPDHIVCFETVSVA